jgi:hypothetical protein
LNSIPDFLTGGMDRYRQIIMMVKRGGKVRVQGVILKKYDNKVATYKRCAIWNYGTFIDRKYRQSK